ncbi:ATP-dependent Clp protease proteolytic subunit [Xenorhabdus bovienii]|nr:ATP-dependent Clp protease proteolytic subunit [Xenorhabdus bovienii]
MMHSEYPELTEENNAIIPTLKNKLLKSRSIIITGETNQQLAEKVISQLLILQEVNADLIKIFIFMIHPLLGGFTRYRSTVNCLFIYSDAFVFSNVQTKSCTLTGSKPNFS